MRAVTIVDGELMWEEHPDPVPGKGEVVVEVRAAGLNGADLVQLAGFYPAPPGSPPDIPGLEAAGEVVEVGEGVSSLGLGDRVMALVGGGGQAERIVVHERCALHVPDDVGWEAAGGFAEAFTTAHDALFTQAGLRMGERVCVHGAAGGVGTAAVQLAAAAGAQVTATVRNPGLRDAVAQLGATAVDPAEFVEHGPFDVILELVGGPNLADDIRSLATGGRVSVIGVGAGAHAEINLFSLMATRGRILGSTLRSRPLEDKAAAARAVENQVLPLLASGRIHVPVAATYPLADAPAAYAAFRTGGKFGKIVLAPG